MPNTLLATLPADDLESISGFLSPSSLFENDVLEQAGRILEDVYFLEDGLASLVVTCPDIGSVGIAMIGPEAMSGLSLLFGVEHSPFRCVVQRHGPALKIPAERLSALMAERPSLHAHLLRAAHAVNRQMAETALFNSRGSVLQRLSRWLLIANERLGGDELPLTHEGLAMLMGVRRSSVTVALNILQRDETLMVRRASITILDREKLVPHGYNHGA